MKVFLSWSGERSRQVAESLCEWIPNVIQAVRPWVSGGIAKGSRWSPEVAKELQDTQFGIVCLTPENLTAPWLLFEAGALSKTLESAYVCPYLVGLKPTDLQDPLAQFQATMAERNDTLQLMKAINAAQKETALSNEKVDAAFEKWWPDLEANIAEIAKQDASVGKAVERRESEVLEEILTIVRDLRRDKVVASRKPFYVLQDGEAIQKARGAIVEALARSKTSIGTGLLEGITSRQLSEILGMPINTDESKE